MEAAGLNSQVLWENKQQLHPFSVAKMTYLRWQTQLFFAKDSLKIPFNVLKTLILQINSTL